MTIGLYHYLGLGAALFAIGLTCVVTRRNAIGILIGVELILNAANVNLVGFSRFAGGLDAQVDVGGVEDQLDADQHADGVAPRDDADEPDREQRGAEKEVVVEADGHACFLLRTR